LNWDWFGDTLGIGLSWTNMQEEPSAYAALAITDRVSLLSDISALAQAGFATEETEAGVLVLNYGSVFGLVGDDVFLIGEDVSLLTSAMSIESFLADDEGFVASSALLPAGDYNIRAYTYANALTSILEQMQDMGVTAGMSMSMDMNTDSLAALGGVAFGATVLEGRTLVLDIANVPNNSAEVATAGVQTPVDLSFADHLPAYTQLLIHDS